MKPGKPGIQFPYRIAKSQFGVGVFFMKDIPKGSLVWKRKDGVNIKALKGKKQILDYLATFKSEDEKRLILDFAYFQGKEMCIIMDDAIFTNHSTNPNCAIE